MKSNLYKSLLGSVIGASMFSLNSCTDLSETIYSQIASEKYEFTENDASSMFAPVYSSLRSVYWAWYGYADLDICTDLWCIPLRIGVGWGDLYINFHKHDFHQELYHLSGLWSNAYAGINACNRLLADEAVQSAESSVAQLRAYRALYYYLLFDAFRNIPLDTQFEHEDGWQPEQATPQQMWDFIMGELEDVQELCGTESTMNELSNYAVRMIKAKMYLNHNAWFNDHSDDSYYKKCIDELNVIISSNKFSLAPAYSDNFKEDISDCPEIIFGIPFEYLYASGNYFANLWMNEAGRATFGFTGWATGGGGALGQFLDTYDEDDTRFTDTWIGGPQVDQYGEPILVDGARLDYTWDLRSIDNPGCYPMEGYRMIKYEIKEGDWGTSYDDVPFFRYADVLLMKAECLLRLGGYNGETEQDAADLVTKVRERAFKSTNPDKAERTVAQLKGGSVYKYGHYENTAKQDETDNWVTTNEGGDDIILGGLLDELAWEFVAEHHRRQDLIRFRMTNGQNVFNGKSWFCKERKEDVNDNHCNIFPIPKSARDGNINLKQNDGYQQ